MVLPTWFSALGDFVFVSPEGREHAPATFQWGALPSGWVVGSDLEQGLNAPPLTVSNVTQSTMLGGLDVKLLRRPIAGGELRVAMRGSWMFSEDQFADDIATIVDAQRRFWGSEHGPYFVSVVPLAPYGGISVGGNGEYQGFGLYGTSNADEFTMRRILAHEHTHNWIPFQQGRMPDAPRSRSILWYSEGFTDFYTDRTLLRSGVWKLNDFVRRLNQVLREYGTSPVRTAPNSRIVSDFWTDNDVQKLAYERGDLLASIWDGEVRSASHGRSTLDQVMFAMRNRYAAAPSAQKPDLLLSFQQEARRVGGIDVRRDIERFAVEGERIDLPNDLFGQCATIRTVTIPSFDIGFDMDASAAKGVFAGVEPDGPAYRSGLRDGMKRVQRLSGELGDSRVEVSYRVLDQSGGEQVISYRPEGRTTVSFQQVELRNKSTTDTASCVAVVAGQGG